MRNSLREIVSTVQRGLKFVGGLAARLPETFWETWPNPWNGDGVRTWESTTLGDIGKMAVVYTCRSHGHAAIIYESSRGNFRKLEYDSRVRGNAISSLPQCVWATRCDMRQETLVQFLELCVLVDSKSTAYQIPYRYRFSDESRIDPARVHFLPGPGTSGLTCASFLLLLFYQCGIRLIRYGQWEVDNDDVRSEQETVQLVRSHGLLSMADDIEAEVPSPRCRPEELLASVLFNRIPVGFLRCRNKGRLVADRLKEAYARNGIA